MVANDIHQEVPLGTFYLLLLSSTTLVFWVLLFITMYKVSGAQNARRGCLLVCLCVVLTLQVCQCTNLFFGYLSNEMIIRALGNLELRFLLMACLFNAGAITWVNALAFEGYIESDEFLSILRLPLYVLIVTVFLLSFADFVTMLFFAPYAEAVSLGGNLSQVLTLLVCTITLCTSKAYVKRQLKLIDQHELVQKCIAVLRSVNVHIKPLLYAMCCLLFAFIYDMSLGSPISRGLRRDWCLIVSGVCSRIASFHLLVDLWPSRRKREDIRKTRAKGGCFVVSDVFDSWNPVNLFAFGKSEERQLFQTRCVFGKEDQEKTPHKINTQDVHEREKVDSKMEQSMDSRDAEETTDNDYSSYEEECCCSYCPCFRVQYEYFTESETCTTSWHGVNNQRRAPNQPVVKSTHSTAKPRLAEMVPTQNTSRRKEKLNHQYIVQSPLDNRRRVRPVFQGIRSTQADHSLQQPIYPDRNSRSPHRKSFHSRDTRPNPVSSTIPYSMPTNLNQPVYTDRFSHPSHTKARHIHTNPASSVIPYSIPTNQPPRQSIPRDLTPYHTNQSRIGQSNSLNQPIYRNDNPSQTNFANQSRRSNRSEHMPTLYSVPEQKVRDGVPNRNFHTTQSAPGGSRKVLSYNQVNQRGNFV